MLILRLYARVLAQLKAERGLALTLVAANIAVALAQFAEPLLLGRVVDRLAAAQGAHRAPSWGEVAPLVALWGGFGLFTILAGVLVALYSDRLAQRRRMAAMANFFAHLMDLPQSFHRETHSGQLTKIMADGPNQMFGLWLTFFREHCAAFVALGLTLPATLAVNWRFALVLIALVGLFGVAMNLVIRATKGRQGAADGHYHAMAAHVADALANLPMLQAFASTRTEAEAYRAAGDRFLTAQYPVLAWWALATVSTRTSATLTLIGVLVCGIWLDMRGQTTLGQIVAFMALAGGLIGRLDQINNFLFRMFGAAPDVARYFETMAVAPAVADRPGATPVGRLAGHVRFEGVHYAYGERPALIDVSFEAKPGQTVALVGATGSGKSTALAALHRAFDVDAGRVTVDGIDVREMTLASLRAQIGVVLQEPYLLARSVEDNLRVGKPDATSQEIARALKLAQADFVRDISAEVGERGRNLSGGERQRLSIARALIKDPPILVLDEATAALDAATEARLQGALESARRGRTTFVIAHRLSTVVNADVILVFDRGRIVERGSYEELLSAGGAFAALARAFAGARAEVAGLNGAAVGPILRLKEFEETSMDAKTYPVTHTDAEWRSRLTPEQYHIMREHGTERAGSCALNYEKRAGVFSCAGCDQPLFESKRKFESGTGWPSFDDPLPGAVETSTDRAYGMVRTEVHCARCGSHLGHVFPDGPPPTGLRYCINGVATSFAPAAA